MRAVLHLDMDAFFAAVEMRDRPELQDQPVVVGADPRGGRGRGVVSTANYAAREYGVTSGMPISEAYQRCREAVFLPVDGERYSQVSERIMGEVRTFADSFEQTSIDEAYLELTGLGSFQDAVETAQTVRQRVQDRFDLTCSLGVATNRTVAKIASDQDKPDGLTVVRPGTAETFLADKDVGVIPGVGSETETRLRQLGVETAGDLAEASEQVLRDELGSHGLSIRRKARGIDPAPVEETTERKSLGTETTFREDIKGIRPLTNYVAIMSRELAEDLARRGLRFKTVELKLRRSDFETFTRQRTLDSYFSSARTIETVGTALLDGFDPGESYRLLGLRVKKIATSVVRQSLLPEFSA